METTSILISLAISLLGILQPAFSAPIMFLCNKTDEIGNPNAFLCKLDIQTDQRATEWKATIKHFSMSINAITGIMLAMIIVIFVSIVFNIVRYRSNRKSITASSTTLVPQRKSEVLKVNVVENGEIDNNYEAPITSGCEIQHVKDGNDDYMNPAAVEENLYDMLEHEKPLVEKGITTIVVNNSVYNEVDTEAVKNNNLYDALEITADNATYGDLDKPTDSIYDELEHP